MKAIESDQAPRPVGPYSQAIIHGDLVFLSGQIALDHKSGNIEGSTIEAQTEQVMKNIQAILTSAGSSLSKAIKCTVFLSDINDFAAFNKVYEKYLGDTRPARSTIQAGALPKNARVEVDVVAYR